MAQALEYSILDVFAERPLEGNPLAVIHDARGLSDATMQAIAREMNLSETTFVLPAENPEQDRTEGVRVRIFTTKEELPFAGHPTLGTASWLHLNYAPLTGAQELTLRLNVGPIRVRLEPHEEHEDGVFATMWQNDAVFGELHHRAEVAHVLGLEENDLLEGAVPQTVSTGNPFCVVGLRLEALERLAIPQREACAWLAAKQTRWFYCVAPESGQEQHQAAENAVWRARMQFYSGEDPATGSAAGCAIAWMVRHGWAASEQEVVLRQGIEMGRPSRLVVRAVGDGEVVRSITVSGRTIPVARGSLFLSVYRRFTQPGDR
ncbi:MAG TPA: PhzF family phenazine biosynthesis protein [Acidobacteriaceae bacterium]|jgi:trans-2,3-dihydro-3-hydroxyanthranilate isomerase|nr:PhzF family phenazine biosynthesis protein [Acidobacteriaceae bacterium]